MVLGRGKEIEVRMVVVVTAALIALIVVGRGTEIKV